LTAPAIATYARVVGEGKAADLTWRRRRVYAGVAVVVLALLLASLLVDPPAERERRAELESRFEAIRNIDVIHVDPSLVPSETYRESYDRWRAAVRVRECAQEQKAAARDGRVQPVEAWRVERACGPH
jgi:hypothetical protein